MENSRYLSEEKGLIIITTRRLRSPLCCYVTRYTISCDSFVGKEEREREREREREINVLFFGKETGLSCKLVSRLSSRTHFLPFLHLRPPSAPPNSHSSNNQWYSWQRGHLLHQRAAVLFQP